MYTLDIERYRVAVLYHDRAVSFAVKSRKNGFMGRWAHWMNSAKTWKRIREYWRTSALKELDYAYKDIYGHLPEWRK